MAIVRGRANTASGSKYLQQLCKHWGHKFEVEFSKTRGQVRFPSAIATMDASADALLVSIETDDTESAERLKEYRRQASRPIRVSRGAPAIQVVSNRRSLTAHIV